jgi:large subunit ribosomal protein L23
MTTIYEILRRPIVTEKSNYLVGKLHKYVFEVDSSATKSMVKDAVEKVFKVTVLSVNVVNAPAKRSRRSRSRRLTVRNSGYKKAIVTLPADARIPMFEGVE